MRARGTVPYVTQPQGEGTRPAPFRSSITAAHPKRQPPRKRGEKRSAFDLEPPIAGHQSIPKRFAGHGAELVIGPFDDPTPSPVSAPRAQGCASDFRVRTVVVRSPSGSNG